LQHSVLNIPDHSRSVIKSAAYLLPYVLEKMKDQKEFLIVGYSFGSLIAIELARSLEAKNTSGQLILIDGAPDQMKFWSEQYFNYTSQQELQNIILLGLMDIYCAPNKEMLSLELDKYNTWEEKLEVFHAYFLKDVLTKENQKLICTTIYDHIIAIQDYNVSLLPRLKSPIILLKPTITVISSTEEDYGLHKVTEGKVQIYHVEGTHVTMMDSDKIASVINGEGIEE